MKPAAVAGVLTVALLGCDGSSTRPEPEPPGEEVLDIGGFRIMRSSTVVFEWRETDPAEADTLEMTWRVPLSVRFVWTAPNGDSIAVPASATLIVSTANTDFATWRPASTPPFYGTFETGGFPEVETSFRVVLTTGTSRLSASGLMLHVSRP